MFPQATLSKPAKGSVVSQSSQFRKMAKKSFENGHYPATTTSG